MVRSACQLYRYALGLAVLIAFSGLATAPDAEADFSGGTETFDGTIKDTDTWTETVLNPPSESVTQNDELILTAITNSVDYTTRFTVGVGDTVSAELISIAGDEAGLYLTTDSQGTTVPSPFDSHTLRLTYRPTIPGFIASVDGPSGSLIGFGSSPPTAGNPYVLQIERTSSTVATFTVFDSSMSPLGSTLLFLTGIQDRLFISLVSTTTSSTFDNVTAPEPCGNGFTEGVEECDDGNVLDGDGCSSQCILEFCGDGIPSAPLGEECDDGNNENNDGCSATCKVEFCGDLIVQPGIGEECETNAQCGFGEQCSASCLCGLLPGNCGNGVIEFGEECDDSNTLPGDGCSADCEIEQVQSTAQQKCINELNRNFQKVAKTQGKEICSCIKDGSKGKLTSQTIEECITSDNRGKVSKAEAKTESKAADKCSVPLPDFAATDPNTVNQTAVNKELTLVHDIFGPDLDQVIVSESLNKTAAKCQQGVAKAAKKCQDTKLKEFNRCKKDGLRGKSGLPIATARQLTQECLMQGGNPNTPQPDPRGKIQKACATKIGSTITKKCTAVDRASAFPGCNTNDPGELSACIDQLVECQVCVAVNSADNLGRNCDLFDDGQENGSCADFAPDCGNGMIDIGEQCDDGNTDACDGCSRVCANELPLQCGDGILNEPCGEECDDGGTDTCDGCSATCQAELGFTCGDGIVNTDCGEQCEINGDCDFGEECNASCQCQPIPGIVCGNGNLEAGEDCDDGNLDPDDCCSPTCQFESSSTICRISVDLCDAAETCSGTDPNCPLDQKSTGVCRPAAGLCDVPEICDGISDSCPADALVTGGTTCRPVVDAQCDLAESCSGSDPNCPTDVIVGDGMSCDDSDVCTDPDACLSGDCVGGSVCGNGNLEPGCGEQCEIDGDCAANEECDTSCMCEVTALNIGMHKCVLAPADPNTPGAFCNGGNNDGLPCTTTGECFSGGGFCDPISGLLIETVIFTIAALSDGAIDIECGIVDPNTGKASCECGLQSIEPIAVPGIGFVCLSPGDPNTPCDLGEIDCDGGNGLDVDLESDHNIGACSSNAGCETQCSSHCAGLGKSVFDSGCEGFCEGGTNDGNACTTDAGCPGGSCPGPDALPHSNICGCSCIDIGGASSQAGGLQCNLGVSIVIETGAPCDQTDTLIVVGTQCIPMTTETATASMTNANDISGTPLPVGGSSSSGIAAICNDLASSTATGLELVGAVNFFDSAIGDLAVTLRFTCE